MGLLLQMTNTHTRVLHYSRRDISLLDSLLSYEVHGAERMPSVQMGYWDGRRSLLDKRQMRFPTGLVPLVLRTFDGVDVQDLRERPEKQFEWKFRGDYREHQTEMIEVMSRKSRGIIEAATASGKSASLYRATAMYGVRTLIVVHRRVILSQMVKFGQKFLGIAPGVIGEGEYNPAPVTVALVQSLHRRYRQCEAFLDSVGCLMIDEYHHSFCTQFLLSVLPCPAYYRWGWTATSYRESDDETKLLSAITGRVWHRCGIKQLQDKGELSKAYIVMLWHEASGTWHRTYHELYKNEVVLSPERNRLVVGAIVGHVGKNRITLVIVKRIQHGKILQRMLAEKGIVAEFVYEKTRREDRERIFASFARGDSMVLIGSYGILGEGFDIPCIGALVMAGSGKAKRQTVQQVGRGLRKKPGMALYVTDIYDTRNGLLQRHADARRKVYEDEPGFTFRGVRRDG